MDEAAQQLTRVIYGELLDEKQLADLLAFYRTDLGQSMLRVNHRFAEEFERRFPAVLAELTSRMNDRKAKGSDHLQEGSRPRLSLGQVKNRAKDA
jgi:hypothetical protein